MKNQLLHQSLYPNFLIWRIKNVKLNPNIYHHLDFYLFFHKIDRSNPKISPPYRYIWQIILQVCQKIGSNLTRLFAFSRIRYPDPLLWKTGSILSTRTVRVYIFNFCFSVKFLFVFLQTYTHIVLHAPTNFGLGKKRHLQHIGC